MSLQIKCGTLSSPTSTGNQSYSGPGFQPKLVMFFTTGQTAAGVAANAVTAIGVATSTSSRFASCVWSDDAQATSQTRADTNASRCIRLVNGTGTTLLSADFVSFDTGGFTLNWLAVDASARIISWIALGGDFTVWCGSIDSKSTTGNQAYTGVGFQPKAVLFMKPHGTGTTTTAGGGVTIAPSFGFAVSSTQRACVAGIDVDGAAAADSSKYFRSDKCYAVLSNTSTVLIEADHVSMDADGFTLNWTTANATTRTILAVAIAGCQAFAGTFNQRSGTGTQAVTGVGFQPKGLVFMGPGSSGTEGTHIVDLQHHFGWTTGSGDEQCMWAGSSDASDPTECDSAITTTKAIQERQDGTTNLQAEADLQTFDADGFTLDWTTADTTLRKNYFLALGELGGSEPGPWIEAGIADEGTQQFLITGLQNGVEYDVRVKARDDSGNTSAGTTPVAETPVAGVARPAPLRAPLGGGTRPSAVAAALRGRR